MCGLSVCNSTQLLTADRLNMLDQVVVTLERFISQSHLDGNSLNTDTTQKNKKNVEFSIFKKVRSTREVERPFTQAYLPLFLPS